MTSLRYYPTIGDNSCSRLQRSECYRCRAIARCKRGLERDRVEMERRLEITYLKFIWYDAPLSFTSLRKFINMFDVCDRHIYILYSKSKKNQIYKMISHIKEKIWFYKTICLNTNMQIYSFFGKKLQTSLGKFKQK